MKNKSVKGRRCCGHLRRSLNHRIPQGGINRRPRPRPAPSTAQQKRQEAQALEVMKMAALGLGIGLGASLGSGNAAEFRRLLNPSNRGIRSNAGMPAVSVADFQGVLMQVFGQVRKPAAPKPRPVRRRPVPVYGVIVRGARRNPQRKSISSVDVKKMKTRSATVDSTAAADPTPQATIKSSDTQNSTTAAITANSDSNQNSSI